MQFQTTITTTQVPDPHAQAMFLVLATKWDTVDREALARAFRTGSVFNGALPKELGPGADALQASGVYAVLPSDLPEELAAIDVDVYGPHRVEFFMVAATNAKRLVAAWGRHPHKYGRHDNFVLADAARRYRERHGETHVETLARATP